MDKLLRVRECKDQDTGDVTCRHFLYEVNDGASQFEVQVDVADGATIEDAQTVANTRASAIKAGLPTNTYPPEDRTDVAGEVTL